MTRAAWRQPSGGMRGYRGRLLVGAPLAMSLVSGPRLDGPLAGPIRHAVRTARVSRTLAFGPRVEHVNCSVPCWKRAPIFPSRSSFPAPSSFLLPSFLSSSPQNFFLTSLELLRNCHFRQTLFGFLRSAEAFALRRRTSLTHPTHATHPTDATG